MRCRDVLTADVLRRPRAVKLRVFFFQAEDGIRDLTVTGVQTCALPIFLLVLVGVVGLWRRTGGGFRFLHRGTPPPPPEGATHAPAATPMSVNCRRCGKPIDLTTHRRPVQVMCPSCGATQVDTGHVATHLAP